MQNYAFDPAYLRGLGSPPSPPPPLLVQGVGQDPLQSQPEGLGREPEGLGQGQRWATLPKGMNVVRTAQGHRWLLAFVSGSKRPNVTISGYGFSFQKAIDYFAAHAGNSAVLFTFSNNRGHYLFAYETVKGRRVIKLCTDGLHLVHTPGGKTPWKAIPGHQPAGVGEGVGEAPGFGLQFPTSDYTPFFLRPAGVDPTKSSADAYIQVYPGDPAGVVAGTNLGSLLSGFGPNPGSVQSIVSQITALWPQPTSPSQKITQSGHLFLTFHDSRSGAPQTQGLPPGMALYRFRYDSSGSPVLAILSPEGFHLPSKPAPTPIVAPPVGPTTLTANIVDIATGTSPYPSFQAGVPTGPGLWWNNYSWIYVGSSLPTSYPPGAQTGDAGLYGHWALVPNVTVGGAGVWLWFSSRPVAMDAQIPFGSAYSAFLGGDGVVYANYGNASHAASGAPMTPPVGPPPWLAGTVGQWVNPSNAYWVWIPAVTATTSYTWLLVLLGLVTVGGVGYYLLD